MDELRRFPDGPGPGSAGDDSGNGIAVGPTDEIWTTGSFEQSGNFNPGSGTFPLTSHGGDDLFLAGWLQPFDLLPPVIAGEAADQPVSLGGTIAPFQTLTGSAPTRKR